MKSGGLTWYVRSCEITMSREHGIAPICQHLHSDVASLPEGRKQLLRCNDIPSDHSREDFEGEDFFDDEKCDNELPRGDVRFGDGRNNPRRVDFAIPLAVGCGVLPACTGLHDCHSPPLNIICLRYGAIA